MNTPEIRPCPFCGSIRILPIMSKTDKDHFLPNCEYAFCYCKGCGTRGPWAYKVDQSESEIGAHVINLWNQDNAYYKEDPTRKR